MGLLGNIQQTEYMKGSFTTLARAVQLGEVHRKQHIFNYRQYWQELEELEDNPQIAAPSLGYLPFTESMYRCTGDINLTLGGAVNDGNHID